jgi:PAS domain S-box-containing protein
MSGNSSSFNADSSDPSGSNLPVPLLSTEDLAEVAENAAVPASCINERGRIIWANRAELEFLGYEPDQYLGHHVCEFHPDQVRADELLEKLTQGQSVHEFEALLRRADGSTVHVAISASPLKRAGKLVHSCCSMREMTGQRKLEIELRERAHDLERLLNRNESLLAQLGCLLEGAPAGIGFLDTRLRFVRLNRAMAEINGIPVEAHIGLRPHEILKTGGEELEELYHRVLQTRRPELCSLDSALWGQRNSRKLVCSCYPVLTADSETLGLGVTLVDVTEQQKIRTELASVQDRLQTVIHSAPIFMWAVDKQGHFTFAEGAAMAALGLKSGDLDGVSAFERFGHLPEIEALKRALKGEPGQITPKVGDAWFDVSLLPTYNEAREITGVFGVAVDVTERQAARSKQRDLERSLDHSRRMESLRVMAGGLGHHLNNLLTVITGNVNLAFLRMPPSLPARYNLEQINTAAQQAADLTREMLACGGGNQPQLEALDVNRFVESLGGLVDLSLGGHVMVYHEFSPLLPAIAGDAAQLGRMLMSLIRNAAEAIGTSAGTITLSTGLAEVTRDLPCQFAGKVELPPGEYVFIEIADDGCGMDNAILGNLFEPFFSTKKKGLGLSLAAALGVMRAHRGAIVVDSHAGRGTIFRLLFPASTEAVHDFAGSVPIARAPSIKPGACVLVVDDDEAVRQVARMILEGMNLKVLLAEDGYQAVDMFRERHSQISLVILDLSMPGLSGEETFAEFQKLAENVPVVVSTGYSESDVLQRFGAARPVAYLPKPYSPAMVREVLAQTLSPRA